MIACFAVFVREFLTLLDLRPRRGILPLRCITGNLIPGTGTPMGRRAPLAGKNGTDLLLA